MFLPLVDVESLTGRKKMDYFRERKLVVEQSCISGTLLHCNASCGSR